MATLEEIVVKLSADTSELKSELNSAAKIVAQSSDKMSNSIKEFSETSSKQTSFFQQSMATMSGFLASQVVLGAFNMLKDAASALTDELIDGAKEAEAEAQAMNLLANSLRLSGNYSVEAADDLEMFASEMESLAGISQDVIQSNMAMLSSLTRLDAQGIKAAQQSAIELSAALGKDLDSSTRAVALAINGNETQLKKMGIQLDLTSDKTKNLELVTAALTDRFGGSAAAKMQSFSGQMFLLKDAFGDMFKEMSKSVTQNEVFIAVMGKVSAILNSITESATANGQAIKQGLGEALLFIIQTFEVLARVADYALRVIQVGFNSIQLAAAAIIDPIMSMVGALAGISEGMNFDETKAQWEDLKKSFEPTKLQTVADTFETIGFSASDALTKMKEGTLAANTEIANTSTNIAEVSEAAAAHAESLKSFAVELGNMSTIAADQFALTSENLKIGLEQDLITQEEYFASLRAMTDAKYAEDQAKLNEALAAELITRQQYDSAKVGLQTKQAKEMAALNSQETKARTDEEAQRAQNFKSTMGTISSLAASSNKELAAIGKAAAITQATIDGYAAVQKALASAPPPFNYALAAAVGVAAAGNVAKIAGVGLANGITEVPRSAGGGNNGDNFPATLMAGERVVPTETNQDLKAFLANQNGGGSKVNVSISIMPGTGLNNEQIGNLVDQMNNYFNGGGLKLSGAT